MVGVKETPYEFLFELYGRGNTLEVEGRKGQRFSDVAPWY